MASLGHVAVGILAGRSLPDRSRWATGGAMVLFSGLALLPDLDYLGVMMGVPDEGPCGHRGATHSLMLPLVAAAIGAMLAGRFALPRWRTALLCGLVVGSHALLDALTTGSRGVPLLWPLSFTRFEMPWRPIPNAPCGLDYVSREGLRVAVIEFFQFLPLVLLALRPARGWRVSWHNRRGPRTDNPPNRPLTQRAVGTSRLRPYST
ncbi:MAG: metal-dependent hydrolase [Myxococcales bacterium]